ncbi:hypothetical protein F8O01_00455 [Pseudoclavibacter chungangensis]|uniref:Alpha/beta hydrolase n=1 Tax=Pseudoclavibacter chungangensis TaxID=587635 RepID=A0A7J5C1E5_9MICO|nr:hypothetical protein [Pseudoclavibacter chungangensis]KAB1662456.1 hypothetical protein F8O01_00455 [Pseudoclavibacter chungangensis]NYJ68488.1 hypothetical protein [Pseudoclavibacter chungangensis]
MPVDRLAARPHRRPERSPWRADARTLDRLTGAASERDPDRTLERATIDRPPAAETVRRWWDALDDTRRARLVERTPLLVGNLDGVPWPRRIAANHATLRAEISTRATSTSPRNARRVLEDERLTALSTGPGLVDRGGRPRFVLARDPDREAIVEYVGPAIADTDDPWASPLDPAVRAVGLFVPGNESDLRQFEGKAHTMSELVHTAAPGSTGLVVWQGGRFPVGPFGLSSRAATLLANRYGRFANAIPRDPDVRYVALGFSFGGSVVGAALARGLRVDAVGHLASAGLGPGVARVADLPAAARVPHYAFMAPGDTSVGPLLGLDLPPGPTGIGHGGDPLRDPAVVRLETGFERSLTATGDLEVSRASGLLRGHATILEHWGTDAKHGMGAVLSTGSALRAAPRDLVWRLAERIALPWSPLVRADYAPSFVDVV